MKKEEELLRDLREMIKETQSGRLHWEIQYQTTEYNSEEKKPVVEEEGTVWTVDECYVSYHCEYKRKEFLMISYEMLHSAKNKSRTTNLIFLPPLGIRVFDINALLPYAVEASQMLVYEVHMLWLAILEEYKKNPEMVALDAEGRELAIEDDGTV